MKPAIVMTVHTKPTHLHSHLLLQPHTGKRSKSKRECKQPHPCTADQTANNVDNLVYIQQRQHFGQTEGQLITAVTVAQPPLKKQNSLFITKTTSLALIRQALSLSVVSMVKFEAFSYVS